MKQRAEKAIEPRSYLTDTRAMDEGLCLGGAGVWRWKINSEQLEWTRNFEAVHRLPPRSFDGSLTSFQRDLHPDDAADVWQKIMTSIETGAPYKAVYRTAPRPGVADLYIETFGGIFIASDGARYLTGVCLDVTKRVQDEKELMRRLAQQNAVARFGSFALGEQELQKVMDRAVQVAAEVLQVPFTKILQFADSAEHLVLRAGVGWANGLVGHGKVGIERESQAGFTLMSAEPVIVKDLPSETRFNGPKLLRDHKVRSGISVVISGLMSNERPFGVFGLHATDNRDFDRSDADFLQSLANIVAGAARHVASAEQNMLLVREMAHRAGNMLQLVTSIAAQTFHAGADTHIALNSFADRLSAFARSNYVVSRGGWKSTRFLEVIEDAMKPFGDQVVSSGRDILLPPQLCFDMGLVIHELKTNSMKYGSLGADDGKIGVRWSLEPREDGVTLFRFEWKDSLSGSSSASTGTGFGSKLIRALIERKWNGVVTVDDSTRFITALEVPVAA